MTPRTFADVEAILAEKLPNYVRRPQQGVLAQGVEAIFNHGGQLLGQAGCGVGKSLAYLIPAILSGQRVIVATSTKALQEQIAGKDMPLLEAILPMNFTWAVLKGRANYLCRQKMAELSEADIPALGEIEHLLKADAEHTGDIEHFDIPEMNGKWGKLTMSSTECPGKSECPLADNCFSEKAKELAADADVVITNTAMLMLDLRIRQLSEDTVKMLGDYDLIIIDEAHELPEIATNTLSEELRSSQIDKLAYDAMGWITGQGETTTVTDRMKTAVEELWFKLEDKRGTDDLGRPNKDPIQLSHLWIVENQDNFVTILEGVRELTDVIRDTKVAHGSSTRESLQRYRLIRRCENMEARLVRLLTASDTEVVRWLETETRFVRGHGNEEVLTLKASPIEVGPFLQEMLWDVTPAVLVSATLAVGRDFKYMIETLGLTGYDPLTIDVGTPFDYNHQARLFIPAKTAPSPKKGFEWQSYAQQTTLELVKAAGGGALLLFTSRKAMNQAYDALTPALVQRGIRCIKQGDAPNKALAKEFAEDTDSVLFALKSFFVGVDFQGDTCRLVVIDKLPFPVPSDILFSARCGAYEARHGSRTAFGGISIPIMTLTLVQGFGRLIRHLNDAGVVAILDSRLSSTGYGKGIVRNLPPAPVVNSLGQVETFYATVRPQVPQGVGVA